MEENKKDKVKQYQHEYYLKTREKRREKIKCDLCERTVCFEYLDKHKKKMICERNREKPDNPQNTNLA